MSSSPSSRIPVPFPHQQQQQQGLSHSPSTSSLIKRVASPLAAKMNGVTSRHRSTDADEVAVLKEQLAKARADLSLARSQLVHLETLPSSSPSGRLRRASSAASSASTSRPYSPSSQIPLPRRRGTRTISDPDASSIRLVTSASPSQQPQQQGIRASPSSRLSPDPAGLSRIPVSAVSFGRVLAGDPSPPPPNRRRGPATVDEEADEDDLLSQTGPENLVDQDVDEDVVKPLPRRRPRLVSRTVTSPDPDLLPPSQIPIAVTATSPVLGSSSLPSRASRGNPFFSSGGGRDRGAMIHGGLSSSTNGGGGNTTKVITTLQTDLLYARSALEQSKAQLRQNQRATESLTRQVDDLRESMSRSRLENEGLTKMLARKERTVAELMERVKKAEGELGGLRGDKKELENGLKRMTRETEEQVKEATRRKDRAEAGYEAVKAGVKGLTEGWRREVEEVRKEMKALEERQRVELEESKLKYQTLAKLHASRSTALSTLTSTLTSLQTSRDEFAAAYSAELSTLRLQLSTRTADEAEGLKMAQEVRDECKRFKRMLRGGPDNTASSADSTPSASPAKPRK